MKGTPDSSSAATTDRSKVAPVISAVLPDGV
jgi:hypothetical protein